MINLSRSKTIFWLFIGLDVVLAILNFSLFIRLSDGFHIPDEEALLTTLHTVKYPLITALIICVAVTAAIKAIINDVTEQLKYLSERIYEYKSSK